MSAIGKSPCDEAAIRSKPPELPRDPQSDSWVLAAAILGSSMAFIDGTVVSVALPAIQKAFNASVIDVQWVVESYALFLCALLLVGGSLGDVYGRRRIFAAGVGLFAAASAWCGLATGVSELIIARAFQGVAGALLVPGSLALISASFPADRRGAAIGTWSGFSALTAALGPVIGGWLVDNISWRAAFFVNLPIAAATLILVFLRVPESKSGDSKRLDFPGAILVTAGLCGLVYGLLQSSQYGWRDARVFVPFALGILAVALFLFAEARSPSPMAPPGLFRSRVFSGANALTLFMYAALSGVFFFFFPMNLIQIQGYPATAAGAASLPLIVVMFLLSRWSGGLVARYGSRLPLTVGPLIAAVGFALFARPATGGTYWSTFFPAVTVLGLGMAITVAPLTTTVMGAVDQQHAGIASGINNAVSRLGGLLAIAILGIVMVSVYTRTLERQLRELPIPSAVAQSLREQAIRLAETTISPQLDSSARATVRTTIDRSFVTGFRAVMLICSALALLSGFCAWTIIGRPREALTANSSQF
jgi:EmrB/QacA subfamily drug resistance transporter